MKTLTLALMMTLGLAAQAGTSTEILFTYEAYSDTATTFRMSMRTPLAEPNAYKVRVQYACGEELNVVNQLVDRSLFEKPSNQRVTYHSIMLQCPVNSVKGVSVKVAPVVVLKDQEQEAVENK